MIYAIDHSTRHGRFKPPSFESLWDSSVLEPTPGRRYGACREAAGRAPQPPITRPCGAARRGRRRETKWRGIRRDAVGAAPQEPRRGPSPPGTPGPRSRRLRERVGGRMAAKTAGSRTGGAAVEAGDRGQRPEALPARASRRRRMGDARDGLRVDRPAVPHPRSRRHVCGSRGRWVGLPRTSERTSRVAVSIVGGGRRGCHGTAATAAGRCGVVPLEGDLGASGQAGHPERRWLSPRPWRANVRGWRRRLWGGCWSSQASTRPRRRGESDGQARGRAAAEHVVDGLRLARAATTRRRRAWDRQAGLARRPASRRGSRARRHRRSRRCAGRRVGGHGPRLRGAVRESTTTWRARNRCPPWVG